MKSPKPYSVGRIVLFIPPLADGNETREASGFPRSYGGNQSSPLPAIIVRTWENTGYQNDEINLKVFTDAPRNAWHTSVPYSEEKTPDTWHWPEIK